MQNQMILFERKRANDDLDFVPDPKYEPSCQRNVGGTKSLGGKERYENGQRTMVTLENICDLNNKNHQLPIKSAQIKTTKWNLSWNIHGTFVQVERIIFRCPRSAI